MVVVLGRGAVHDLLFDMFIKVSSTVVPMLNTRSLMSQPPSVAAKG